MESSTYLDDPEILLSSLIECPLCLDQPHELVRNGRYSRGAVVSAELISIWIYRKKCTARGVSFSMHPGDLVLPYCGYPRGLVLERLWASIEGSSYRDRAFLVEHGLELPAADARTSWSDSLDIDKSRPSYGLMWRWTQLFDTRAQNAVGALQQAFLSLGLDLHRDFAFHLRNSTHVQPQACWLVLALGLWRGLMEGLQVDGRPPGLKDALPSLVDFLLCSSSHTLVRAFSPSVGYYGGAAGRSPPTPAADEGAA